ncbi:MAG: PAS domain S-box protein [Candidatus Hodarchaeales archaeon]|jgi:PAS domain S-box-containing protein
MSFSNDLNDLLAREDIPQDVKELLKTGWISYQESIEKLEKSEKLYRSLVTNSRDIIFTVDREGVITSINPAVEALTGWTVDEWIGKPFHPKIHPDDLDAVIRGFTTITEGETFPTPEVRVLTKSGIYKPFEIKGSPQRENGRIVGMIGFAHSRHELRVSENRYQKLIETVHEGVWITDLENRTLYVNPALEKMLGWSLNEMLGRRVEEYLTIDSLKTFDEKVKERFSNGISSSVYELSMVQRDGSIILVRVAGTVLLNEEEEVIGSFGLLTDITSEKEAQERYRNLIEFNPDAITLTDINFIIMTVNDQALNFYGVTNPEELIGVNALDLIVPEDRQYAIAVAEKTLAEGRIFRFEYTLLRLDGSTFPAEFIITAIEDSNGEPTSFMTITRDITERKISETRLVESEEKYRTLVENVNTGIFRVSNRGRLLQANQAFISMFGFTSFNEIASTTLSDLYAKSEDRDGFIEELYDKGQLNAKDVLMKNRDDIYFWASISARVSPNGKWHDGIIEDITERKYAEEAIMQIKLEEERYHAMMSHFLRNDLQKVVSNLELLSFSKGAEQILEYEEVKEIIAIANRSSKSIDLVTMIFEVLQRPSYSDESIFDREITLKNFLEDLPRSSYRSMKIDIPELRIAHSGYLPYAINELVTFLIHSNDQSDPSSPILVDGHSHDHNYCLTIRDHVSTPIPKETCDILTSKITDKWESHGFYIGILLASVVLEYLKGELKIVPSFPYGNEFQMWIPNTLINRETNA